MACIAIDYDGTYTTDPELWRIFINRAIASGHDVYIVTMRTPRECLPKFGIFDPWLSARGVPIIATSRTAKRPFCAAMKVYPHIWIDDNPQAVDSDAMSIWGNSSPEGAVIDPHYPGRKDNDWKET